MLLHLLNFYSEVPYLKNALYNEIQRLEDFQLNKYRSIAEKSEKQCHLSCLIFTVFVSSSYLVFHPILGRYDNLPTIYFVEFINSSKIVIHIIVFFLLALTIYTQLFAIFNPFYVVWGIYIQYLKLKEYIDINLCKEYDNFDVINSKFEQDMIYLHLMKCTKFHRLLKQ